MKTLRIFISSPGDVAEERQVVGRVVERLQGKYWSFVRLDDVLWERRAIRATAHFQDELVHPGHCEFVVGILAGRLGSPLPAKFAALAGTAAPTGTEWELEEAFSAYEASRASLEAAGRPVTEAARLAKPDILVYRRLPASHPKTLDDAGRSQLERLEAYLQQNYFHKDGTIKRPILHYDSLEDFEEKLQRHLEELILRAIPTLQPGFDPPPISGNPFKGLEAFDYEDSDRFFGRNRAIREVQELLRRRAEGGCAFVLIYGASGYGKSSLMRAGLAPRLNRPGGALEGMDHWRRVLLQPARGTGSLCERLALALLTPSSAEERERAALHEHYALSGLPELVTESIGDPDACRDEAEVKPCWDVASLARYLADPEDLVFAVVGVVRALERAGLYLLLQIDQLEEIFAEGVDAQERAAFFRALQGLSRCGRVWTLATMRSEFFSKVGAEPELRSLLGKDGGYILEPPDLQSWGEIIRLPALAARLEWERTLEAREIGSDRFSTEDWLCDQILADVKDNPGALPLLEFCLDRLYHDTLDPTSPEGGERVSDQLRWNAYCAMQGLGGAIATEADRVYASLPPSGRDAERYLFAALVRVEETVNRRRADRDRLEQRPGAKAFLQAFLDAKLLVTDVDGGRSVVTLAHESLLSHWPVLAEWIDQHRGDLAAHQRLIRQTELWRDHGRSRKYLLSEGHLAEAERVAAQDMFPLGEDEAQLLRLSQTQARKRLRRLRVAVAVAGFALLAIVAGALGWMGDQSRRIAEDRRVEAEKQRQKADEQTEIAQREQRNAQSARNTAEEERRAAIEARILAEDERQKADRQRELAEAATIEANAARDAEEISRAQAETREYRMRLQSAMREISENNHPGARFHLAKVPVERRDSAWELLFTIVNTEALVITEHQGNMAQGNRPLPPVLARAAEDSLRWSGVEHEIHRGFERINHLNSSLKAVFSGQGPYDYLACIMTIHDQDREADNVILFQADYGRYGAYQSIRSAPCRSALMITGSTSSSISGQDLFQNPVSFTHAIVPLPIVDVRKMDSESWGDFIVDVLDGRHVMRPVVKVAPPLEFAQWIADNLGVGYIVTDVRKSGDRIEALVIHSKDGTDLWDVGTRTILRSFGSKGPAASDEVNEYWNYDGGRWATFCIDRENAAFIFHEGGLVSACLETGRNHVVFDASIFDREYPDGTRDAGYRRRDSKLLRKAHY